MKYELEGILKETTVESLKAVFERSPGGTEEYYSLRIGVPARIHTYHPLNIRLEFILIIP
jgi:hypothetical protein